MAVVCKVFIGPDVVFHMVGYGFAFFIGRDETGFCDYGVEYFVVETLLCVHKVFFHQLIFAFSISLFCDLFKN